MANKYLVIKMIINSKDFENGLVNAKAKLKQFESLKRVKSVIQGMTKAFGALGIAIGGAQFVKSFISSTQTMGDAWENTMVTAKTSFQVFETAVVSGTGTILSNFRESIKAAREFAEAMDSFGSAQISNQYARMEYVTPFNEAMTRYREAKSAGDKTKMAFAASDMQRNLKAYQENAETLMQTATDAVTAKLSAYTGGFINKGNVGRYLDQLYLEIVNGVLPEQVAELKDLRSQRNFSKRAQMAVEYSEKWGTQTLKESEALIALSEINDDTLKELLGILNTYDQVRNDINSMRRQMNLVVKGETTTTPTPTSKSSSKSSSTTPTMTTDQIMEYLKFKLQNEILNDDRAKDSQLVEIEVLDEDIIEEKTDTLVESLIRAREQMAGLAAETQLALSAATQLGGAFTSMGQIADGTLGNIFSMLGQIIGQIVQTISAMMTLAGAETVEGVADLFANTQGDLFKKLAVSAAGLAGILSIIATAKSAFAGSFAEGGVVPGSSYTGDRLWARVNSGEMILNQSQQAALFAGGGQVRFVIEGSQLKGVLDNYETIQNL